MKTKEEIKEEVFKQLCAIKYRVKTTSSVDFDFMVNSITDNIFTNGIDNFSLSFEKDLKTDKENIVIKYPYEVKEEPDNELSIAFDKFLYKQEIIEQIKKDRLIKLIKTLLNYYIEEKTENGRTYSKETIINFYKNCWYTPKDESENDKLISEIAIEILTKDGYEFITPEEEEKRFKDFEEWTSKKSFWSRIFS